MSATSAMLQRKWCPSKKHFAELDLQHGGKTAGIDMIWRNYVTVTLCIWRERRDWWMTTNWSSVVHDVRVISAVASHLLFGIGLLIVLGSACHIASMIKRRRMPKIYFYVGCSNPTTSAKRLIGDTGTSPILLMSSTSRNVVSPIANIISSPFNCLASLALCHPAWLVQQLHPLYESLLVNQLNDSFHQPLPSLSILLTHHLSRLSHRLFAFAWPISSSVTLSLPPYNLLVHG